MARYLSILEVSQKQAFIFSSNKLQNNIVNSQIIAHVLSPEYLAEIAQNRGYSDEKNMVYSGGGHTILEFESKEQAREICGAITSAIYKEFNGLKVFVKTVEYDENLTDEKNPNRGVVECNLRQLTAQLEIKKSIREASFGQGTFGIEAIDASTLTAKECVTESDARTLTGQECVTESDAINSMKILEKEKNKEFVPANFEEVSEFGELGGTKGTSNFIAVIHIDGNGMGKRVEELYGMLGKDVSWEEAKKKLRLFSESIDSDFKDAFKVMNDIVAKNLESNAKLSNGKSLKENLSLTKNHFPIRRIITAGDDICFVTEGRIGIECAVQYIKALTDPNRTNRVDNKGYSACAGVAIVHQKYPFYKAYELAEILCSNAKKYGAEISPEDNGRQISAVDWHIEYGELMDSLASVRSVYNTDDGKRLEMRPYIVKANDKELLKRFTYKKYSSFRSCELALLEKIANETYSTGKIKELRGVLKKGAISTEYYLKFNGMTELGAEFISNEDIRIDKDSIGTGKHIERKVFDDIDGVERCTVFDAIEIMDTFLEIGGE